MKRTEHPSDEPQRPNAAREQQIRGVVYEAARQMDAGEHVDFVAIASDRPDLMPELLEHLERLAELNRRADTGVLGAISMESTRPGALGVEQFAPADSSGVAVPDHELIRVLGRGGFGVVWLAKNELDLCFYAIKLFSADAVVELDGVRRFRQLATEQRSLVPILHVGRAGEHYYYVMPLADDVRESQSALRAVEDYQPKTLQWACDTGVGMRLEEVIALAEQLCDGLAALHCQGMTHCDVKPANVLQLNGAWCLGDIGLVSRTSELDTDRGTRAFWPPEGPRDPSADVFALGKTLYLAWTAQSLTRIEEFFDGEFGEFDSSAGPKETEKLRSIIQAACHPEAHHRTRNTDTLLREIQSLRDAKATDGGKPAKRKMSWRPSRRAMILAGLATALVVIAMTMTHFLDLIPHDWENQPDDHRQLGLTVRAEIKRGEFVEVGGARFVTGDEPLQRVPRGRVGVALETADGAQFMAAANLAEDEHGFFVLVQPSGSCSFWRPDIARTRDGGESHKFEFQGRVSAVPSPRPSPVDRFAMVALVVTDRRVADDELTRLTTEFQSMNIERSRPWNQQRAHDTWYFDSRSRGFPPELVDVPILASLGDVPEALELLLRDLGHRMFSVRGHPHRVNVQAIAFPVGSSRHND